MRHRLLITWLLLVLTLGASAQKFYNLSAEDVEIDSILPRFTCSIPLGEAYQDSTYSISIAYPEFIAMSKTDIAKYNSISGALLPEMPSINQNISISRKKASLEISFCPLVFKENKYQILVSFMLKVEAKPLKRSVRKLQAKKASAASRYVAHSVLSTGNWAKIRVPSTGVYQLTDALIRQAGFNDLNKVKIYGYGGTLQNERLTEEDIIKYDDLKEVATCTVNGKRLFYAKGPVSWSTATTTIRTRNPYSDYGYYFITQNDSTPLTVDSTAFLKSFYPSPDDYHILHEVDNFSWFHGGRNLFENSPINLGSSMTYTLNSSVTNTSGRMSIAVSAGTNSQVGIEVNGENKGTMGITLGSYDKGNESTTNITLNEVQATNQVKITCLKGGPIRLDYISITLAKAKAAPNLLASAFPTPEYVYNIVNQDHHADSVADMIIIIPTSQKLLKQAQRLADFHVKHDNLRVRIVPADELINEFGGGTPDANAYRKYLKMLYDRAEKEDDMPKYLLLFGDGAWDNRMNTSDWKTATPDDYLLCYESENSFNEIHCYVDDGFYALLDDGEGTNPMSSDKLDMAVGRFPVTTESEAKIMVDKTISYVENANAGSWQNMLVFMGDDGNKNIHMNDVNEAAEETSAAHPGYIIKKVMWDAYKRESSSTGNTYPEASKEIKQYQANGALIMDYAGHGREDQMSHENVLRLTDFESFNNANLPLWITASCDIMPWDGSSSTIGESAVLNSKGGAVAFFGTTRTVYANYNKVINKAFIKHVLDIPNGKKNTLGKAQMLAKNEMITTGKDVTDNKLQYSLLGDPAISLNLPTMKAVIDSINGIPANSSTVRASMKAGSKAKITGHIENGDNFNGIVSLTVRDSKELITCKQNDKTPEEMADEPFTYYDRTKTLFNGSDSVRNGKFSISFAVPKDINYSGEDGLINIHAVNNSHTLLAHGANNNFTIGGSDISGTDSIGPSIYCYLNSPSFTNGGDVNPTPYFVAQITDQDGINAAGNGIGHDMELIIDGEMAKTYVLNGNFTFDFGSFTSGKTFYNIPELTVGPHKLIFRAWDILNNSSTTELTFNVVRGLEPNILNVSCTNNPAKTSTTFIVTHDRMGSNVDVTLDIFDMSGRLLWSHSESGAATSNAYTIDWNLTVDEGRRLNTGVYLYRIRLSSDGSSQATKAKKLVILSNN